MIQLKTYFKADLADGVDPQAHERRIVLRLDRAVLEEEAGGRLPPVALQVRALEGAAVEPEGRLAEPEDRAVGEVAVLRREAAAVESVELLVPEVAALPVVRQAEAVEGAVLHRDLVPAAAGERHVGAGVGAVLEGAGIGVRDADPHVPEAAVHDPSGRADVEDEGILPAVEVEAREDVVPAVGPVVVHAEVDALRVLVAVEAAVARAQAGIAAVGGAADAVAADARRVRAAPEVDVAVVVPSVSYLG